MFAMFSLAFSTIFIAFGVAAVIGHVLLIDVLLRPTSMPPASQLTADTPMRTQPAR